MNDDTKFEVTKVSEARESYILQISFWQPSGGPVRVLARDEEHAKELLPKLLPGVRDIQIHDVMLEKDIHQPEETGIDEEQGPPPGTKVN